MQCSTRGVVAGGLNATVDVSGEYGRASVSPSSRRVNHRAEL